MDNNRRPVKITSSGARRSTTPRRRTAAKPVHPRETRKQSGNQPPRLTSPKKLTTTTALIIAAVAVIVICVPLMLLATSSVQKGKELPEDSSILIAPATATPGDSSTVVAQTTPEPETSPEAGDDASGNTAKTYQRDDKDAEVSRIQQRLMELGYMPKAEPTELYGPATEEAVKLFQSMNDLTADGVATEETQNLLYSESTKSFVLTEGVQNLAVSQLQTRLRELGYLNANSTAYYGTSTIDAVKRFQQQNNLDADGKVGITTWNKVFSSDAAKAPDTSATPAA